jgi:hypothetical protein
MLSTIAEITRDLLIFVGVIAALLVALVVVVSKMPNTNPLKRILTALCYRLAATLAAGAVAIPLEPIPGIDLLYDMGVPIVLIWYWFTFFRDARRATIRPIRACSQTSEIGRMTRCGASWLSWRGRSCRIVGMTKSPREVHSR